MIENWRFHGQGRTQDLIAKRGGRVSKLKENWLIWPQNRLNLHDLVVKRGAGPNRPIPGSAPVHGSILQNFPKFVPNGAIDELHSVIIISDHICIICS